MGFRDDRLLYNKSSFRYNARSGFHPSKTEKFN